MIPDQYVWLAWSSAFLLPWAIVYALFPAHRKSMMWASLFTAPFGLTEPLFVPEYWTPPSLLNLAERTGFDIESLIFCFAIGGIGAMVVGAIATMLCRPDLANKSWVGGILFLIYYVAFLTGLEWSAPGYIDRVWNLQALSGVTVLRMPLEELLFAVTFGMYWSGVYEHSTWARPAASRNRPP